MTYGRWPNFKSGLLVNPRTHINPQSLTPTQKMVLARNRIWGNYVGGNMRSGYKELKKPWSGQAKAANYEMGELKLVYPFIDDWEKHNNTKMKYEARKNRIFMRGIKIGNRKTTDQSQTMSIFEKAKRDERKLVKLQEKEKKEAEAKEKEAQAAV